MKIKAVILFILALFPATLLLNGCWTNPYIIKPSTGEISFTGGMVIVAASTVKATVAAIDIPRREVVLKHANGILSTNVVGPEVVNLDQVKVGDAVKADIGSEVAIFIVKNGPLPSSDKGVLVEGAAKGQKPSGVIVATHDYSARVIQADRSFRLLTVKYADGSVKTFKVPLPFTLENIAVGDNVVVRATETIAIHVQPKK
jgi:hypothetical protein